MNRQHNHAPWYNVNAKGIGAANPAKKLTPIEEHAIEVAIKSFYQRTGSKIEAVFVFWGAGKEPRFEVWQEDQSVQANARANGNSRSSLAG